MSEQEALARLVEAWRTGPSTWGNLAADELEAALKSVPRPAEPAPRALPSREAVAKGLTDAFRAHGCAMGEQWFADSARCWLAVGDHVLRLLREHASAPGEVEALRAQLEACKRLHTNEHKDRLQAERERDEAIELCGGRVPAQVWGLPEEWRTEAREIRNGLGNTGAAEEAERCAEELEAALESAGPSEPVPRALPEPDEAVLWNMCKAYWSEHDARVGMRKALSLLREHASASGEVEAQAKYDQAIILCQAFERERDQLRAELQAAQSRLAYYREQHEALRAVAGDLAIAWNAEAQQMTLEPSVYPEQRIRASTLCDAAHQLRALLKPATPEAQPQYGVMDDHDNAPDERPASLREVYERLDAHEKALRLYWEACGNYPGRRGRAAIDALAMLDARKREGGENG